MPIKGLGYGLYFGTDSVTIHPVLEGGIAANTFGTDNISVPIMSKIV